MSSALPIHPDAPWLAPLAGYSDLPFRLLCREQGCQVAVTEMISAKGLLYKSPGTQDLLRTCTHDAPLVVQLFGAEETFLVQAVSLLRSAGFHYFDLNCGCPVRKVTKTGSGAALLKTPEHLLTLAQAMIQAASPGCVGFKIRLGWQASEPVYLRLAQELEHLGAGWITLHPRFASQGFTGQADWSHLTRLKQTVRLPVIASGDLFTAEDAVECIRQSNVDTIMFARGALNDPLIFHNYAVLRHGLAPKLKASADIIALLHRLRDLYTDHDMARQGLLKMRTLAPRFFKNLPGARTLRRNLALCLSWDDFLTTVQIAAKANDSGDCT